MTRSVVVVLLGALAPASVFAIDGQVLINQSTVMAQGGFPYVISNPGSYKLSGNLQAKDKDTDVIRINTDNVTIDMNGFSILGSANCSVFPCTNEGFGRGIASDPSRRTTNVTIRNGTIQGMGGSAIDVNGDNSLVEYMHIRDNGNSGIQLTEGIVQKNNVDRNDGHGITISTGVITDNKATRNAIDGINCNLTGTISRNVVFFNRRFGIGSSGNNAGVNAIGNAIAGNFVAQLGSTVLNQGQNVCNGSSCPGPVF